MKATPATMMSSDLAIPATLAGVNIPRYPDLVGKDSGGWSLGTQWFGYHIRDKNPAPGWSRSAIAGYVSKGRPVQHGGRFKKGLLCSSGADAGDAGKVSDPSAQMSLGPHGGGKATAGASNFGWLKRGLTDGFLAQTNRICDWVSGTDLVGSDLRNHGENLGPHGEGKVMPTTAKINHLQLAGFRNLRLNLDLTIQSMGEKSTGTAGRRRRRQYTAAVSPSAHQCSGSSFPGTNLIFWMGHYEFSAYLSLFCLKLGTNMMSIDFLTRKKRI